MLNKVDLLASFINFTGLILSLFALKTGHGSIFPRHTATGLAALGCDTEDTNLSKIRGVSTAQPLHRLGLCAWTTTFPLI